MNTFSEQPRPVYAVIPAAGTGSRMKAEQNKQFLQFGRYPVIIRTLLVFERHPLVNGYLVVAAPAELDEMRRLIREHRLTKCLGLAAGGTTRQESVGNGLTALADCASHIDGSLIIVHDGARCFVTADVVDRVISGIILHKACGAAVPVKDTIKRSSRDGQVIETLDRSQLWAMQTPQGAEYQLLRSAYERAATERWQSTDDLSVLEQAGIPVHLVDGDNRNIKLTTPEDRLLAEKLAEIADLEFSE